MSSVESHVIQLAAFARIALWRGGEDLSRAAQRAWRAALGLWLAAMIATPIVLWTLGPGTFPAMATLGVLAHAGATSVPLVTAWGWPRWLRLVLPFIVLVWLIEWIGVQTRLPFGAYRYTALLQPQVLQIPLSVTVAWYMMLIPAWAVGRSIAPRQERTAGWIHAALAASAFTAWDLYLDPQMAARALWVWEAPGAYFGVPLLNYAGWWVISFGLTLLLRPEGLPRLPLLAIYTLTWLFQALALGVFWGQPGPALCGFLAMGCFTVLAWRAEARRWSSC
jgi:putative membrane protein